uniref:Uncharacterized protein n=1 Tax=Rhizophora mucronata TaxID=61149 RepID=A0A2P2NP30_RHIMU
MVMCGPKCQIMHQCLSCSAFYKWYHFRIRLET